MRQAWLITLLLLALWLAGGCRRAVTSTTTDAKLTNAQVSPAPQPSVCVAEKVSRSALLRQATAAATPTPAIAAKP